MRRAPGTIHPYRLGSGSYPLDDLREPAMVDLKTCGLQLYRIPTHCIFLSLRNLSATRGGICGACSISPRFMWRPAREASAYLLAFQRLYRGSLERKNILPCFETGTACTRMLSLRRSADPQSYFGAQASGVFKIQAACLLRC